MVNQQLLDYIKSQLQAGIEEEKIRESLRQVGWREEDIEEGFREAREKEEIKSEIKNEGNGNSNNNVSFSKGDDHSFGGENRIVENDKILDGSVDNRAANDLENGAVNDINNQNNPMAGNPGNYSNQNVGNQSLSDSSSPAKLPSAGDLLKESWHIFLSRWKTLVSLALIAFLPPLLINLIVWGLSFFYPQAGLIFLALISPLLLLSILFSSWGTLSLIYAISNSNLGFKESLKRGWHKIISYWWVMFLGGLIITGGYMLLIIPGVIFSVWFSLAAFILIEENITGMNALLKSKKYVEGYWGSVFWRFLFFTFLFGGLLVILIIVSGIVSGIISGIFKAIGAFLIEIFSLCGSIIGDIGLTIGYIYGYRIYYYLRNIKKDLVFAPSQKEKVWFVVAGIIGIIAPLLLLVGIISLVGANKAREISADTSIRSQMSVLRTEAELYYDDHQSSYEGFCQNNKYTDRTQEQVKTLGRSLVCRDSKDKWAACVNLKAKSGYYYCVDNQGSSEEIKGTCNNQAIANYNCQ